MTVPTLTVAHLDTSLELKSWIFSKYDKWPINLNDQYDASMILKFVNLRLDTQVALPA